MKRAYLFTILTLLVSLSSTSQTDTSVRIKPSTAIKIVKDLERCDELRLLYGMLERKSETLDSLVSLKDAALVNAELSVARWQLLAGNLAALDKDKQAMVIGANRALRKTVRIGRLKTVMIVGVAAVAGYIILFR